MNRLLCGSVYAASAKPSMEYSPRTPLAWERAPAGVLSGAEGPSLKRKFLVECH